MERIDWHAGFVPAMKLELRENVNDLVFEEKHPVDNHGNEIDLLIIRNDANIMIKSKLGAIFERFNVLEYKSPEDSVDLGVFFKTLAYTSLYLREVHKYEEYGIKAFTMTIVSSNKPIKTMKLLERDGILCTKTEVKGIYYLSGKLPFKTQIIVTRELPKEYVWLDLLTKEATEGMVKRLVDSTKKLGDPILKDYADDVANVFLSANDRYMRRLKEENPKMCKAVDDLFAEEHRQELAEKDAIISKKDAQLSKKNEQIEKLKKQIAKLQSQSAVL